MSAAFVCAMEDVLDLYAAAAVMCFAFGMAVPIVDSNVIRVLGRVFSVRSRRPRAHIDPEIWHSAAQLLPEEAPASYNRAVLDLAATVCTFKQPRCAGCPLRDVCDTGRERLLAAPSTG